MDENLMILLLLPFTGSHAGDLLEDAEEGAVVRYCLGLTLQLSDSQMSDDGVSKRISHHRGYRPSAADATHHLSDIQQ